MSKKEKPIVALIYDFDGTLSPGNMQEYAFIQAIGKNKDEFWKENKELAESQDADQILTYMLLMLQKAQANGISLKKESFQKFGESVELFNGVEKWFDRINEYGKKKGVTIEHYINSSGLKEMIEGTKVGKKFNQIFASSYLYTVDGIAQWPAIAVNFTNKTQFLFKINKGITSANDTKKINEFINESDRRIPFNHMIYFGDGATDIPCMKLVKQQGGHSIAVYPPRKNKEVAEKLITENRVNFVCPADYSEDKEIDVVVKTIIDKIKADSDFNELMKLHKEKAGKTQNK
ncbi:HAD family hydrolase [uncultured Bacteroides sp.]|uniref:HAD family hydrolase n=1 Tax=uncultured Bacteroides sp. TaxID=162156 RepID=UPI002AAB06EF|nr:HAD family hydrolase [uncultured Bacteroides sp.]